MTETLAEVLRKWPGTVSSKDPSKFLDFECPACGRGARYFIRDDVITCGSGVSCPRAEVEHLLREGVMSPTDTTVEMERLRGRTEEDVWTIRSGSDFDATIERITAPGWKRPEPTVGMLTMQSDESPRGLFYPGRLNCIYGDGDSGKTLTMLLITIQEMESGRDVLYLDYEDEEVSILGMLIGLLSAKPDDVREHFHYVEAHTSMVGASEKAVLGLLDSRPVSLVVIDSTGEALALEKNFDSNNDSPVSQWMRKVPRRIVAHPSKPCVVLIDHLPKDVRGFVPSPIGSGRKRNVIRGAQYHQLLKKPFAAGVAGYAELICSKDKGGNYTLGQTVGRFQVDAGFALVSHDAKNEEDETVAKVRRMLAERPGLALGEVGRPESLARAVLDQMLASGEAIKRDCEGGECRWGEGGEPCSQVGANKRLHLFLGAPTSS